MSGPRIEDEGEEIADVAVVDDTGVADAYDAGAIGAYDTGPTDGNMGERITSMSPFERLMIEVVHNQLFELQYGKED
ncbi:hypothetical protein VNO80_10241 [Phaseolus coccineus]|uniref:Uncharacterized protein n=1 Tax=Phaseolus coccineus TaxID=3886 RepID=A0AAN9N879_PHACN